MKPRTVAVTADPALRAALALLRGAPTHVVDGLAVTRTGRCEGTAPTVLLVPGVGASRTTWAPMLPALAARYDVVAMDLPGHGESELITAGTDCRPRAIANRLAHACALLGLGRPHLLANSLGGWIGLEMAADGVLATFTGLAPAGLSPAHTRPSPILKINRLLARTTAWFALPLLGTAALRRLVFASGSADPVALDVELARDVVRALRDCAAYEAMLDATAGHRFERRADIMVPVTVVFGDRDHILPAPDHQDPTAAPAHTRWVVLPRCGHSPMWDAPTRCLELLEETIAAAR